MQIHNSFFLLIFLVIHTVVDKVQYLNHVVQSVSEKSISSYNSHMKEVNND